MRQLIVTADDVGLHPGMTAGAIRAHREGIVTACSIVANGRAFDDAVARLREAPTLEVGVHLSLVEEKPLTAIRVPRRWTGVVARYPFLDDRAVESELRAQIDRVMATGLRITHLNGHQHLHLLPRVFTIVQRLAEEYSIPYIRTVDDHGGQASPARRASVAALSLLGRRARVLAPFTCDRTLGVLQAGRLTAIEPLLDHVAGLTEMVTHPGLGVAGYDWGYDWEGELRALCTPGLRTALERRGIVLTTPSSATLSPARQA